MSQLELAAEAGTSPRHVSFLETGRSRPGRELVLRLATALEVPLRERNAMLVSAGLPPEYPVREVGDAEMDSVRRLLDRVLSTHEPYPAWVVGRGLRFIASNRGAEAMFPGMCDLAPEAIVDLWFGPGPFRERVQNWPDVVWTGLGALRREAAGSPTADLLELLRRAEAHARHLPPPRPGAQHDLPIVCADLKLGESTIRTISAVMR